ncbi:MmcQ/YjbR family DNA-binding protein [Bacteroidota bacterium]
MDLKLFREYCLSQKGASEDFPFDETTLVFRVGSKIFALTDTENIPYSFNLKCEPERAVELREIHSCIIPGWHMNKKHWNTVEPDGSLSLGLIKGLIDHSYELVFKSLKKSEKEDILENK